MLSSFDYDLTVSIVLYETDITELRSAIGYINKSTLKTKIFLVDNSPTNVLEEVSGEFIVDYIFNNSNLGYGTAHNIAINKSKGLAPYHLVMNADVDFDPAILQRAYNCMEENPDIGLLSPKIHLRSGEMQHFCRLLPKPFDLFARRFIPNLLKRVFKTRLDKYILMEKDYSKPMNVPNLPGCFMFMRIKDLLSVGGFDEGFFMYVEDIDLTRRLHRVCKTVYYPDIAITHGLARGSYKFSKLVLYHIKSAIYYFNKWGWILDKSRNNINKVADSPVLYVKLHDTFTTSIMHKSGMREKMQRAKFPKYQHVE